ncbi:MAG: PQQ-like beta-propeller repeat protein [Planctomycetia bacterium]|nr:PQQ-like beta-propeller repeat protein [Planctomycetia bacterium]
MQHLALCLLLTLCVTTAFNTATAAPPADPPPRPIDFIPPQWMAPLKIHWRATWDETLAANPEQQWQQEIGQNKALANAAGQIVGLWRIELLTQLIERFPYERERHYHACREIAIRYQHIGMNFWRSYYALRAIRDYPEQIDKLPETYIWLNNWPQGNVMYPESAEWEFGVHEVLRRLEDGSIPANHPATNHYINSLHQLWVGRDQYDELGPLLARLERLGKVAPNPMFSQAANVVQAYGHRVQAAAYLERAGNQGQFNMLANVPLGAIEGLAKNVELETRWETLSRGGAIFQPGQPLPPDEVQSLLDLAATAVAYLPQSESHFISFWNMTDDALLRLDGLRMDGPRLAALRDAQQKKAEPLTQALRLSGDADELSLAFRRFPFARCIHELMIESGEQALRDGRAQWASAALRGVIRHTDDATLRNEAYLGLWLALAESSDRAALETELAAVPDETPLPWRGGTQTAGELKKQLLAQTRVPGATPQMLNAAKLADLPRRRIALSANWPGWNADGVAYDFGAHAPWPISQVQAGRDGLYVTGSDRLARFDAAGGSPTWLRALADAIANPPAWDVAQAARTAEQQWYVHMDRVPVTVRGSDQTSLTKNGRIVCALISRPAPGRIAGFDAHTGQPLWTTAGRDEWKQIEPVSQPAVADDRVYVATAPLPQIIDGQPQPMSSPLRLVCLDARDGRMIWNRPIGWQELTIADFGRNSCAVTVQGGAVYCSTNVGVVARCDARDGLLDWVRGYASAVQPLAYQSLNCSREGTSPLVVGDTLLIAPRDHSGVLAFDCASGKLRWESILIPSDKLLGVQGSHVIGINGHFLAALDLATGRTEWCRPLADGTGSQGAIVGESIVVRDGATLRRIATATGKDIETMPWNEPAADCVILADGTLLAVEVPKLLDGAAGRLTMNAPLALPLQELVSINAPRPRLTFSDAHATPAPAFCIVTDRRLAYYRSRPEGRFVWEHLLPHSPQSVWMQGETVLVCIQNNVTALRAADGVELWTVRLPFVPYTLTGDGNELFAATHPTWPAHVGAVDMTQGKLLWSRPLTATVRFNGGIRALVPRHLADGGVRLGVVINGLYGDVGWQLSEVALDSQTGTVRDFKRCFPDQTNWWGNYLDYDQDSIRYIAQEGPDWRLHVLRSPGEADVAAPWPRKADMNVWNNGWNKKNFLGTSLTPAGIFSKTPEQLLMYDPATRQEIAFKIEKEPQQFQSVILDYREIGGKLVVVSGVTGQIQPAPAPPAKAIDINRSKVFVDFFDRATARHLGRQQLAGAQCCIADLTGCDTQARILDEAIVVSDARGVHLYGANGVAAVSIPPLRIGANRRGAWGNAPDAQAQNLWGVAPGTLRYTTLVMAINPLAPELESTSLPSRPTASPPASKDHHGSKQRVLSAGSR